MKISKSKRRIAMGAAGLLLAGVVFAGEIMSSVVDVQATTKVLDGITTKFSTTRALRILEIVDSDADGNTFTYYKNKDNNSNQGTGNIKSEMGYFMPSSNHDQIASADAGDDNSSQIDPAKASKGFLYGKPYDAGVSAGAQNVSDQAKYAEYMLKLYTYGLIKPNGSDTGWMSNIGEYPIVNKFAVFSSYKTDKCTYQLDANVDGSAADANFTKGVYTPADGNGGFNMISSFVSYDSEGNPVTYQVGLFKSDVEYEVLAAGIDPASVKDYTICTYITEQREVEETEQITLSDNTISENTVTVTKDFKVYTPLSIDNTTMGYPSVKVKNADGSQSMVQLISRAADANGNLSFQATEITTTTPYMEYFGPNNLTNLWLNVGNDNGIKFKNSDWISEYILGSNKTFYRTDAIYDVVAASKVTVGANSNGQSRALADYDLVYISGKAANFRTCDLSEPVTVALYNNTTNHLRQAIMMDYACYSGSFTSNLDILCGMLWQTRDKKLTLFNADAGREDADKMFTVTTGDFADKVTGQSKTYTEYTLQSLEKAKSALTKGFNYTVEVTENGVKSQKSEKLDPLKKSMMDQSFGNGNFVTGNVYVYDHAVANFDSARSFVDAHDNFANGDLISKYNASVTATGLSVVENYITAQNKISLTGSMSTEITPAVCIQYILVSDGEDVASMKTSLNILEIQPVPTYLYNTGRGSEEYVALSATETAEAAVRENREKFVVDYLPNFYADKLEYIGFTSMTISEFNGRNEDLIENYDIVFIGDETTKDGHNYYNSDYRMNNADGTSIFSSTTAESVDESNWVLHTRKSKLWDDTVNRYELTDADLSYFTDSNLIGNIYYNVGDKVDIKRFRSDTGHFYALYGLLDDQPMGNDNKSGYGIVRYPGRDLTGDKLKKMKQFVDSQGLVIVAENLMGPVMNGTSSTVSNNSTSVNIVVNPTICSTNASDVNTMDIHGFVDSSSNLYELLQYGLGYRWDTETCSYVQNDGENVATVYSNMVSAASIKCGGVDKADLAKYVSADKVSITLYDAPVAYSYETKSINGANNVIDKISYLNTVDAETGVRYLKYEFQISTDASVIQEIADKDTEGVIQVQAGYTPKLFIDINNDGKYSETKEDVADILITYTNESGQTVEAPKAENGRYNLEKGVRYTLRRDLSDDFFGLVNWKLSVENTYVKTLHASEQGYTAVEAKNKKDINVLQLNKDGNSNLQTFLAGDNSTDANVLKWNTYMKNVPNYNLHIRTINISTFQTEFETAYNNRVKNYPNVAGMASMSVEEFAVNYFFKNMQIWDDDTKGKGVSMLITGFGDNYDSFNNGTKGYNAVQAIYAFINAGNPVLAAHDFINEQPSNVQMKIIRDSFGQDKYGATKNVAKSGSTVTLVPRWDASNAGADSSVGEKYTHSGVGLSWSVGTTSTDNEKMKNLFAVQKSIGKAIAYEPNTVRRSTTPYTQGYSNFAITRTKKEDSYWDADNDQKKAASGALWYINMPYANMHGNWKDDGGVFTNYNLEKLNSGQITTYPYILPDQFSVTTTHSQYHELDLSTDADKDGESDLVVWYAFGEPTNQNGKFSGSEMYSDTMGGSIDPASGYYIYNKGNITYTGAGHSSMKNASEEEIQLFVNTLLATFETGNNTPTINLYESPEYNAKPINSIVVPYDGNVTNPATRDNSTSTGVNNTNYDSSVLVGSDNYYKYQFVDPNTSATDTKSLGTMAYFRMNDLNFVRGEKKITVKYYLLFDGAKQGDKVMVNAPNGTQVEKVVGAIGETDSGYVGVDISGVIETYSVINGKTSTTAMARDTTENSPTKGYVNTIQSNEPYGFYLPMNYLKDHARFTILVEAETSITSVSTEGGQQTTTTEKGYKELTVTKTDLLELD